MFVWLLKFKDGGVLKKQDSVPKFNILTSIFEPIYFLKLCPEIGMSYNAIAMVTDYDRATLIITEI